MSDLNQEKAEPKEEKEKTKETKEEEKENNIIQEEEKEISNENKEDPKEKEEEKEDEKENEEEKEKSESSKESDSESKESKESKDKKEKDSEENEEIDDEDDDMDDDNDNDEGNSDETDSYRKQKDPYHGYLNSKTEFSSFFSDISNNWYLYGFNQNKFFKIVDSKNLSRDKKAQIYQFELKELKPENKDKKINIKLMNNIRYMASLYGEAKETEKDLKLKVTKEISDKSNQSDKIITKDNISIKNNSEKLKNNIEKKEEKETKEEDKGNKPEEKKSQNEDKEKEKGKDKEKNLENPYKKKNKKKKKNSNLTVVIKDLSEYTFFQKIRVIYLNSLNNSVVFSLKININTSINEIIKKFASLYHYKHNSRSEKIPLCIFINGKMHSLS